jgi:hypothetical protein
MRLPAGRRLLASRVFLGGTGVLPALATPLAAGAAPSVQLGDDQ